MRHLHHYIDGVCADPRAPGGPCGERQKFTPPKPPTLAQRIENARADLALAQERLDFLLTLAADSG